MASPFREENLAVAWIAVEPAGDEREMLAEFLAGGAYGWPLGVLRVLRVRRVSLQIILEDMFGGARLYPPCPLHPAVRQALKRRVQQALVPRERERVLRNPGAAWPRTDSAGEPRYGDG